MNSSAGSVQLFNLISGGLFVSESDVAVFELAQAVVAEGDAKDVRSEILERPARRCRPVRQSTTQSFFQTRRLDLSKQAGLFQFITQLGAEDHAERFFVDQKVFGREERQRPSSVRPPPVTM